jgi:hypothetical protein
VSTRLGSGGAWFREEEEGPPLIPDEDGCSSRIELSLVTNHQLHISHGSGSLTLLNDCVVDRHDILRFDESGCILHFRPRSVLSKGETYHL